MEKFEIIATTRTKTQNNSTFVRVVSLLVKKKKDKPGLITETTLKQPQP